MSAPQDQNVSTGGIAKDYPISPTFEKLNRLNDEIKEGIRNISEVPRPRIDDEIDMLRAESFRERAPEAELSLRLFRKYADISHTLKAEMKEKGKLRDQSALIELPSYIYEGNADQISGWAALGKNIFWLRAITCLFSFLSFVVMSNVPLISYPRLHPTDEFLV
jgi:hypothetical protein